MKRDPLEHPFPLERPAVDKVRKVTYYKDIPTYSYSRAAFLKRYELDTHEKVVSHTYALVRSMAMPISYVAKTLKKASQILSQGEVVTAFRLWTIIRAIRMKEGKLCSPPDTNYDLLG